MFDPNACSVAFGPLPLQEQLLRAYQYDACRQQGLAAEACVARLP